MQKSVFFSLVIFIVRLLVEKEIVLFACFNIVVAEAVFSAPNAQIPYSPTPK